ncbi:periplasmic nitrate reductase, NapE protein [Marinicellulosiphila megalodicopiae]
MKDDSDQQNTQTLRQELGLFALISFVVLPAASVGFIASYGFIVWLSQ